MPLRIGQLQQRAFGAVACAVDQHVDAAPARHGLIDQLLQVFARLVRAGQPQAAQFTTQRLALSGRGHDRHLKTILRQLAGRRSAHATAAAHHHRHFVAHALLLVCVSFRHILPDHWPKSSR